VIENSRAITAPLMVFGSVWRYRRLVIRLTLREIEGRYRGSLLGKLWAVVTPLFMLGMYTIVFIVVFPARWSSERGGTADIALIYFSGLIVFDFMFECLIRAPTLMLENIAYIKKMVFPLEILAWVALGGAWFRAAVGIGILFVFYVAVDGLPPVTALLIPVVLAPLGLVTLAWVWLFSVAGVFFRDVRHLITLFTPVVMFLSPIFYPLTAVPAPLHQLLYLNPLTLIVEQMRAVLFKESAVDWPALALYAGAAWLFASFGYWVFMRARMSFADVA